MLSRSSKERSLKGIEGPFIALLIIFLLAIVGAVLHPSAPPPAKAAPQPQHTLPLLRKPARAEEAIETPEPYIPAAVETSAEAEVRDSGSPEAERAIDDALAEDFLDDDAHVKTDDEAYEAYTAWRERNFAADMQCCITNERAALDRPIDDAVRWCENTLRAEEIAQADF